jgi:hypothetical protein
MGKKCIPGVFCIENMTLFLLIFILIVLVYLYHATLNNQSNNSTKVVIVSKDLGETNPLSTPPQNSMSIMAPTMMANRIPVNIESRGPSPAFTQIGILTKSEENLILPLMGRRLQRDKYQYYTFSNTGNINTKLPVSKNGKSCTGEYGCDEVYNGDTVYVEGYKDTFRATIYENSTFSYIPYL